MRRKNRFIVGLLSAMALIYGVGPSLATAADDSPEGVSQRLSLAVQNQDAAALIAETAPSDHPASALEMVSLVDLVAADPEKGPEIQKQWDSLVAEHGYTDDIKSWQEAQEQEYEARAKFKEELAAKWQQQDLSAFLAAIFDFFNRHMPGGLFEGFPQGELTDLEVDGDSASGMVDTAPAEFVREQGRWYLSFPE